MIYVFGIDICIEGLFPYPGCILYGSMENKYDEDDYIRRYRQCFCEEMPIFMCPYVFIFFHPDAVNTKNATNATLELQWKEHRRRIVPIRW
jgi:hypothetical protein